MSPKNSLLILVFWILGIETLSAQDAALPALDFSAFQKPFYEKMISKFLQEPIGNAVALVVFLGMVFIILNILVRFFGRNSAEFKKWPDWTVPVFALAGLGVAGYLSILNLTPVDPVCGPVGNCGAVQQSPYAHLFGIIHVSYLGFAAYLVILLAALVQRFGAESQKQRAALITWGMALIGTLFSAYLTFLEPFVIGMTCIWCVTSAILISLILRGSSPQAKHAWKSFH
ncbi:MAG: vitamin K epoxide reductase family protein [SAR324 cluster bacterium]|nr:vitamin K epoxide reductase family protein [SAR324 cluster bacterium]